MKLTTASAVKVWSLLIFGVLYLLTTPVRHPYFNSLVFLAVLTACTLVVVGFFADRRGGFSQFLFMAFLGHVAAIFAYTADWSLQGNAGVRTYLQHFGATEMLFDVVTKPFFCYSFALLPIAVALASLISKKCGSKHMQT